MRVIEEVTNLRLQIIAIFFAFVSTVLIQFADFRISKYQNSVSINIIEASNLLQIHTSYKMTAGFSVFKQFLPFGRLTKEANKRNIKMIVELFDSQVVQDPVLVNLHKELKNGSISLAEYYTGSAERHEYKKQESLNKYNLKMLAIKKKLADGTVWTSIKTFFLFPIQFGVICILLIGYYRLQTTVHDRITKKK